MTKNKPDSFDDFLTQISASLKGSSGEAALRRINAERVLRLALDEIVQQRHDLQIRVITDNRISGDAGADILMQVDDYEIRLELMDAPDNVPNLTREQLIAYKKIFEDNPSTEALVITWTLDELLSQKLSLVTIDYLVENSELIKDFIQKAKPLSDIVQDILVSQMRVWEDIPSLGNKDSNLSTDVQKVFEKHLSDEIRDELERSYKTEEKKLAVKSFPEKQEMKTINGALAEALQEEVVDTLATLLVALPRRGVK
jgi:hypothetical protein